MVSSVNRFSIVLAKTSEVLKAAVDLERIVRNITSKPDMDKYQADLCRLR